MNCKDIKDLSLCRELTKYCLVRQDKYCIKRPKSEPIPQSVLVAARSKISPYLEPVAPSRKTRRTADVIVQLDDIDKIEKKLNMSKIKNREMKDSAFDLLERIRNLPTNFSKNLFSLLKNKYLLASYLRYINKLEETDAENEVLLYQNMTANNMRFLLDSLSFTGEEKEEIKNKLIANILDGKPTELPHIVYVTISQFMTDKVNPILVKNASYVVTTPKNVNSSEAIESLGIANYKSIVSLFTNFTPVDKNSASNSIILTADLASTNVNAIRSKSSLKPRKCYFKVFPIGELKTKNIKKYDSDGLQTETNMYNELFKLVKLNITPNILCRVATGRFNNFESDFLNHPKIKANTLLKNSIVKSMEQINEKVGIDKSTKWNSTGLIITQSGGQTLNETLYNVTAPSRKKIMFQILYTLYVFEKLKISHGDLHSGNIFVQKVEPEVELKYYVDEYLYSFKTKYLVKIYDFDHSTILEQTSLRINGSTGNYTINKVENVERQPDSYFNQRYAETNIFNRNLDLCILYTMGLNVELREEDDDYITLINKIFEGFNPYTSISKKTIGDTYRELLNPKHHYYEKNKKQASEIFGTSSLEDFNISSEILNLTWYQYKKKISIRENYGRIFKNIYLTSNNQLWIPDVVIRSAQTALTFDYFNDFLVDPDTDSFSLENVYTLHNKLE